MPRRDVSRNTPTSTVQCETLKKHLVKCVKCGSTLQWSTVVASCFFFQEILNQFGQQICLDWKAGNQVSPLDK